MALTDSQRRKAREKLARKKGVDTSTVSDNDITAAITAGIITSSDYYSDSGSSYSSGSSGSYDSGSSYDSGGSSGGGFSSD